MTDDRAASWGGRMRLVSITVGYVDSCGAVVCMLNLVASDSHSKPPKTAFTSLISSHLLTPFHVNWVRSDWLQPRRTGSLHTARPSSPWLRPITVYSIPRWNAVRWGEMTVIRTLSDSDQPTATSWLDSWADTNLSPCDSITRRKL